MGDGIQRYAPCDECSCLDMRDGEGAYVLFTDHESAVAAAVEERDRQWREQLEGLADRIEDPSKWYGGRVPSLLTSPAEEIRAALGGSTE